MHSETQPRPSNFAISSGEKRTNGNKKLTKKAMNNPNLKERDTDGTLEGVWLTLDLSIVTNFIVPNAMN